MLTSLGYLPSERVSFIDITRRRPGTRPFDPLAAVH
jgi:hypothetical protein